MFFGTCAGVVQDFLHQPSQRRHRRNAEVIFYGMLPKSGVDAGSMRHGPLAANSKHTCTQQADQSAAQHNKSKPSPAQPSQGKQSRSSAKPSMRASNTKHTRPKTQSIRLAYHFNSFRVGCVHTSCRALPLRLTVCLYLNSCP